jgi:hypothetical protein
MKALSDCRKGREACCTLHAICFLMAGILSLLFAPALAMGQWNIQTVDAGDVGQYSSIAVDSSKKVHISYMASCPEGSEFCYDSLKYATGSFGSWADRIVDSSETWSVGAYSSIAVGQSDHVHISYRSESNGFLRYATTASGGTWTTHVLSTFTGVGYYTSIAANPTNDYIHISNSNGTGPSSLEYVGFQSYCSPGTPLCGLGTDSIFTMLDVHFSSIALDSSYNPHMSYYEHYYYDPSVKRLNHAFYVPGVGWTTEIVDDPVDADVGQYSSIAIDSTGNIHISYYDATNHDLKYAKYDTVESVWLIETVDTEGDVGQYSSIALLSNGRPCISYYDATNGNLKFAAYIVAVEGPSGWIPFTVDSTGDVGQYSDVAVDSAGYIHISYYDATYTALKYATTAPPIACTYNINPTSQTFGKTGGTGSISVTTQAGCAWNATTPNGWIHITSGTGSGIGAVTFSVDANEGAERTGTITVGGQPLTVNQSASTCTCAINLQELYAPSIGGTGYKVAVTAPAGCAWTVANSEPSWINITSGASGTGNGTVEFSVGANTVPERTGSLTVEGQVLTVKQRDDSFTAELTASMPLPGPWVALTFDNNNDFEILTIRPSCYRTYFFMTDALGKIVPPRDFITGVAIPDDVVTIPIGLFTLNCDLSRMFDPRIFTVINPITNLPEFTPPFTLMATFTNFITDPEIVGGVCTGTKCYDLWTGAIPSGSITLNKQDLPITPPLPANVSFFPSIWQADWASSSGKIITAQISGITGTIDPTKILLNGKFAPIETIPVNNIGGVITITFDAAEAVQSLGSIGTPAEGYSIRVYPQVQGEVGDKYFTSQGGVDVYQDAGLVMNALTVNAFKHIVGTGAQPTTKKEPIKNMPVRIYSKANGSCAAGYGVSWQNYPSIWGAGDKPPCLSVAQALTDNTGKAVFDLPKGDYLVIGKFVEGTDPALYIGVSVGAILPGTSVYKQLQVIQNAKNEKVPAKYTRLTGSELLIIEPEYVEWDSTQELYPFIFESAGSWSVNTAVSPPEGFVSDYKNLSETVNSETSAVQFTITDVGSKWVPTGVTFMVKHKGKTTKLTDKIGLKLSSKLAKEKGLSIYGQQ